jgi:hypothetical protein
VGLFDFLKANKPLEPVALPVIFSNVAYVVFGEKGYGGELIIAPNAIYFFPHTNLSPSAQEKEKIVWTGIRDLVRDFWRSEISAGQENTSAGAVGSGVGNSAEEKIELLMNYVKENRRDALLADSLPSPVKFSREGIQKLRAGWGSLRFDANFDDHEFRDFQSRLLMRALKSGGYLN